MNTTKRTEPDTVPGGYPPGAEPFLSAIIADREDDTPRLVFADWLQENGDEDRAEFIRLQIELARAQPYYEVDQKQWAADAHENRTRDERQQVLLAANQTAWCAGFPDWLTRNTAGLFHRGLPSAISTFPDYWLADGEWLRRWMPIERLSFNGSYRCTEVLSNPSTYGLLRLDLTDLQTDTLRAMADSPALDSLQALHLGGRHYPRIVEVPALRGLCNSPRLKNLRELRIWIDREGDALGFLIGGSPHLQHLRTLALSHGMHADAARELFDSPNLANMQQLELRDNPIGDVAIRTLVRSKHATRLTALRLQRCELTAESARLLAEWPGLRNLVMLQLDDNPLGLAGVAALSQSRFLGQLRVLLLVRTFPSDQRAAVLALPGFAHIPTLALS